MSRHNHRKRLSIVDIQKMKGETPIVSLTAYGEPLASLIDEHIDILLVGDSLGMVLYGMPSTIPVSLEAMVAHGKAVVEASRHALVVIDMPFASYQESPEQAFRNAARIIKETGAQAVKMEGGLELVDTVRFVAERGIPVMPHIGLKPQHMLAQGGYRYQGKTPEQAALLIEEAKAFERVGAFSLLLEGLVESVATDVTRAITIPTIGIGASAKCDGQVLVSEDMLGMHDKTPRFVRTFADLGPQITQAAADYANAVRERSFPAEQECFTPKH